MADLLHVFFTLFVLMTAVLARSDNRLVRRETLPNPVVHALGEVSDLTNEFDATMTEADRGMKLLDSRRRRSTSQRECTLHGDPHIKPFDSDKKKHRIHLITAKGHWWVVRTEGNVISIQGIYDVCGKTKTKGKLKGLQATCLVGVAVGGEFLRSSSGAPTTLAVKHPCGYEPDTDVCQHAAGKPVVEFNGTAVDFDDEFYVEYGPTINVTRGGTVIDGEAHVVTIALPKGVEIILSPRKRGGVSTNFDGKIRMSKDAIGDVSQCGHCGNFDGDVQNDLKLYHQDGTQKDGSGPELCNAVVSCADRLVKEFEYGSNDCLKTCTNSCLPNYDGEELTLEEVCEDAEERENALKLCKEKFEDDDIDPEIEGYEEDIIACQVDVCMGNAGFAENDADQAVEDQ